MKISGRRSKMVDTILNYIIVFLFRRNSWFASYMVAAKKD